MSGFAWVWGGRSTGVRVALCAGVVACGLLPAGRAFAVTGGDPVAAGADGFVAKVDVGGVRSCTGALVDPRWVVTAAACVAPAGGGVPTAGAPAMPVTVTLGRPDLTSADGRVVKAVEVVPGPDRDVALLRLAVRVYTVAPVKVATAAPVAGESLRVDGYGRTATEWVPDHLKTAAFAVGSVADTGVQITGQGSSGATVCRGDAGGPAVREGQSGPELVGVTSTSWQGGCIGETETRTAATEARVDNLADWIHQTVTVAQRPPVQPPFSGPNLAFVLSDRLDSAVNTRPVVPIGKAGMTPLVGDWNGDGIDTAGAYDKATSTFYLTDDPTSGAIQYVVRYGNVGDVPLVGDWDGDGRDEIGVHRGITFIMRTSAVSDPVERSRQMAFGNAGDVPLVGDWNGDGRDDLGLRRGITFIMRTTANDDPVEKIRTMPFGNGDDQPLIGDWDGDGRDDLGLHRGGKFILRTTANDDPVEKIRVVGYGDAGDTPVVGDWDGDGVSTQGVVRKTAG